MNHKLAPYDEIYTNKKYIEILEDNLTNNIIRCKKFSFSPDAIIEVPKKEILRKNINEKYGIKNVDEYFIPIILDENSYRSVSGISKPDLLMSGGLEEYLNQLTNLGARVFPLDGFYLSYISTQISTDLAIEHEALHAYVFKHSPDFVDLKERNMSQLFSGFISSERESWTEAISHVMTSDNFNIDDILNNYLRKQINTSTFKKSLHCVVVSILGVIEQASLLRTEFSNPNYKYVSLNSLVRHHSSIRDVFLSNNNSDLYWKESFSIVQQIKQNYSTKDAVKILGNTSRSEVKRMLK